MATVDQLIVEIRADTKDLRKKLGTTNKQLEKTGKEAKKAGKGMGNAFSTGKIAIVAATAALIKFVSTVAKVGMEFEDLKDSLDVVFGSMRAGDEAMGRVFQFAQTTPFQVETVTKAFIALQSVGIEPTNKMLQTFADTASVSVDQLGVFEALVRTVQRSAAGGLGLEELNMLSDRGIPALKILQEELGLAKDDIAKFGKTAQGAKIITDALQQGLEKRFGGAMETKMDNLSTKTSNMTIAFKQLGDEIFKGGLGDDLKHLTDRLTGFAVAAAQAMQVRRGERIDITGRRENIHAGMTSKDSQARWLIQENVIIDEQLQKLKDRETFLVKKNVQLVGLEEGYEEGSDALAGLKDARARNVKEMELILIRRGDLQDYQDKINKRDVEVDNKAILKAGEKLALQQQLQTLYEKSVDPLKDVKDQIALGTESLKEFYDELVKNKILSDEITFENWTAGIQGVIDQKEDFVTMQSEMKDAIASTAHAFTNDFVNSLMEGESALESFKNFAKNLVSQIISIFLEMAVVNEILNAVFGLTGANRFSTLSNPNPTDNNAGGGKVQKGRPTWVGERGPEIFVPNTGGTIMNNMNSKNAMGGGAVVVNQSINFATGVVPTVRAEVTKMLPQISDVTKGAVLEAAVRGGSFRKGLMGGG
jgi:hypothetical protein